MRIANIKSTDTTQSIYIKNIEKNITHLQISQDGEEWINCEIHKESTLPIIYENLNSQKKYTYYARVKYNNGEWINLQSATFSTYPKGYVEIPFDKKKLHSVINNIKQESSLIVKTDCPPVLDEHNKKGNGV